MRKILAFILVLVLCVAMGATAFSTPAVVEGKFPPVAKEEIKVGFIYIGDVNDKGYTYAHHQGTLFMQKELGLRDDQIIIKTNVPEDGTVLTAIGELVEQGCSIIFGNSFGFMDFMAEAAELYPDVIFSHCSGYKSNETNFNNYFGRIYQARYLSGIAAGLKTKTNKIGYVAAYEIPEVVGGLNAFTLGVKSVNPAAEVLLKYTLTWYDPTTERQTAEALLDLGCDVIGQHQDTTMPQVAAEARGVWGVGYNADMTADAPKAHLTAPIWNWGVYIKMAVESVIAGTWTNENSFLGMKEGLVDISPLSENVAEGTAEAIEAARAKILSGEFDVFDGPITDVDGNIVVADGVRLDDAGITSMMWYVDGVVK